jgi:ribosomal subunit interface protein
MRLELTGRHVDIPPMLRRAVEAKLARLTRMLNDNAVSAQIVLVHEKRERRADVTLHARGEKFLHAVGASDSWDTSVSQAIDKITQQAQKIKGKWQERKRRSARPSPRAAGRRETAATAAAPARLARVRPRMPPILRASRQELKVMSLTEAARVVRATTDGVLVFRDVETAAISVLVHRTDGELTLVETEA